MTLNDYMIDCLRGKYIGYSKIFHVIFRNILNIIFCILFILFIFTFSLKVAQGNTLNSIDVVLIYDQKCSSCEYARPIIQKAIEDLERNNRINIHYEECPVSSKIGLEYIERYHLIGIPVLIINDNTILGPEEFDGNSQVIYSLIQEMVEAATRYDISINIDRTISRNHSNSTILDVKNYIKNVGNETIKVNFADGIGNGLYIISGKATWGGYIQPGETVNITYNAIMINGVDKVQSPQISYQDRYGFHVIALPDDNIPHTHNFDILTLITGGIMAGINPCIVAILIFISTKVTSAAGKKIDVIFCVIIFCVGIMTAYLIFGICLYRAVNLLPSIGDYLRYIIVSTILALAVYSFYSAYIKYIEGDRKTLIQSLLSSLKPSYIKYRNIESFLLGALFGMIKMPCAGGIYLALLSNIILYGDFMDGLVSIIFYDIGLVLPVIFLGISLALGCGQERLNALRIRYAATLHIMNGTILMVLAAGLALKIL